MESIVAAAVAGVLLLLLWLGANRRHVARRGGASREWDGSERRPDLWTSAARCPNCGESGGLLSDDGEEVWFSCLACGQRHRRQNRA